MCKERIIIKMSVRNIVKIANSRRANFDSQFHFLGLRRVFIYFFIILNIKFYRILQKLSVEISCSNGIVKLQVWSSDWRYTGEW